MEALTRVGRKRTVLLLGGTGRTGGQVLCQCLQRGIGVRAIVRSTARLPEAAAGEPLLTAAEVDPLSLTTAELQRQLGGCDAVISCLGHGATLRGIFGPPFDVVTRAVSNLARAAEEMHPTEPVRLILMSSVSVNRTTKADTRRGTSQRLCLSATRRLVPPARDNQRAADFLANEIGPRNRFIEWVVVRPDTLRGGDLSKYQLSDEPVSSIFRPGETNIASVARFMCDLATDEIQWQRWRGGMPVVVNAGSVHRTDEGST
jgi:nucleoside-diphosphate-sugar epimerase